VVAIERMTTSRHDRTGNRLWFTGSWLLSLEIGVAV
jgi:hypothetical protein